MAAAKAQAAAMDQVSLALAVLWEMQQSLASSVSDYILRAKAISDSTPSEVDRLHNGFACGTLRSRASSSHLAAVFETDVESHKDWTDAAEFYGSREGKTSPAWESSESGNPLVQQGTIKNCTEFWLETFLYHHAFRISGPWDSSIWDTGEHAKHQTFTYSVLTKGGQEVLQSGEAVVGDIVQVNTHTQPFTHAVVTLAERTLAAPLGLLLRQRASAIGGMFQGEIRATFTVADTQDRFCLTVKQGEVVLETSANRWEGADREQWVISRQGSGYRIGHRKGQELSIECAQAVLAERSTEWQFRPVGQGSHHLAVYLVSGPGALSIIPGRDKRPVLSTNRAHWVPWQVFHLTHCDLSPQELVTMPCQKNGIFRAAEIWRHRRNKDASFTITQSGNY